VTILVVDDEPANRMLVSVTLGSRGHEVIEAGSGREALDVVRDRDPQLIVLDLSMPEMDGGTFLKALRGELRSDAAVALYTASTPTVAMRDFMALFGIEDLISKPCEPQEMLRIVERILASRQR
jgi:CheY-like chemotaxis protein